MYKYILISIFLILIASKANSICVANYCKSKITEITVLGNETRIKPAESTSEISKLDCTPISNEYLLLPSSTNADRMYSAILAAQKAQHEIMLRIVNSSSSCEIQYIRVYGQ